MALRRRGIFLSAIACKGHDHLFQSRLGKANPRGGADSPSTTSESAATVSFNSNCVASHTSVYQSIGMVRLARIRWQARKRRKAFFKNPCHAGRKLKSSQGLANISIARANEPRSENQSLPSITETVPAIARANSRGSDGERSPDYRIGRRCSPCRAQHSLPSSARASQIVHIGQQALFHLFQCAASSSPRHALIEAKHNFLRSAMCNSISPYGRHRNAFAAFLIKAAL